MGSSSQQLKSKQNVSGGLYVSGKTPVNNQACLPEMYKRKNFK